jgi:hypothetical protein
MEMLSMLASGSALVWIEVALVLGLFWAALAHPARIRSLIEFRLSMAVLALAVIAPSVTQIFLSLMQPEPAMQYSRGGEAVQTIIYMSAIPPLLVAIAVYLGINSVLPTGQVKSVE